MDLLLKKLKLFYYALDHPIKILKKGLPEFIEKDGKKKTVKFP